MKVFFGTTKTELMMYKEYYLAIRKHLISSGCIILDWASTSLSKSRSEIIRSVLDNHIKQDSSFQDYMNK